MKEADIDKKFSFTDEHGNVFKCVKGKITLKLPSNRKALHIGKIITKNNLLIYCKSEKEKDVSHKHNAWTVPVSIYEKIDGIWYTSEDASYKILKTIADKHMGFMKFKDSTMFEPKVYIPIRFWSIKPVK